MLNQINIALFIILYLHNYYSLDISLLFSLGRHTCAHRNLDCDICLKKFKRLYHLKEHVKSVHLNVSRFRILISIFLISVLLHGTLSLKELSGTI